MNYFLIVILILASVAASSATSVQSRNRIKRVIGGFETLPNQYPFMVEIRDIYGEHNFHRCGASLISESWAVTAAHCPDYPSVVYRLEAGKHNVSSVEGNEQERRVKELVIHEDYNSTTKENDIALFKVDPPFKFDEYVESLQLPPKNSTHPQGKALALGWGRRTPGGNSSLTLRQLVLPILSDELAIEFHGKLFHKVVMLSAGYLKAGMDICFGDSGGPLLQLLDGKWVLVGIASAVNGGCAEKGGPALYTRVSHYVDWILTHIAK